MGAALAPKIYWDRLALTYVGIFFGLCLASYSFDELKGRPLRTQIPDQTLWAIGIFGYGDTLVIGVYLALAVSLTLIPLIALVAIFVASYNLELFGRRLHNATSFAVSWGGLTTFGSYYLHALRVEVSAIMLTLASIFFSLALWVLTHRIIPNLDEAVQSDESFRPHRRQVRRTIWRIIQIQSAMTFFFALSLIALKLFGR